MKTSFLWLLEYVVFKSALRKSFHCLYMQKTLRDWICQTPCQSLVCIPRFISVHFFAFLWYSYKIAPLAPNVHCHPRPYIISNFILISVRRHFTRNIWCLQNKGQTLIYNPHFPTLMSGATSLNFRKNLNSRINSTSFIIKHQAPRPRMLNFTEVE